MAEVKIVKEKYKQLLSLNPMRLGEINDLIFINSKILKAVDKLQKEFGKYTDVKRDTVRLILTEYKKDFKDTWYKANTQEAAKIGQPIPLPALTKEEMPKSMGDTVTLMQFFPMEQVKLMFNEAVPKFDAFQELERVAMMQAHRVMTVMEHEQSSKLNNEMQRQRVIEAMAAAKLSIEGQINNDGTPMEIPEEIQKAYDKAMEPKINLYGHGRAELETYSSMLTTLIKLQMDLGIRHKVEVPQQHLHFHEQQKSLTTEFKQMERVTEVATNIMEILRESKRKREVYDGQYLERNEGDE